MTCEPGKMDGDYSAFAINGIAAGSGIGHSDRDRAEREWASCKVKGGGIFSVCLKYTLTY